MVRHSPVVEALTPPWHQLIVIGNGFDLECGLKSRYSDYAAGRADAVTRLLAELSQDPVGAIERVDGAEHVTVWDIILRRAQDPRWYDIESVVESWVKRPPADSPDRIDRVERLRAAYEAAKREETIHEDILALAASAGWPDERWFIDLLEEIVRYLWATVGPGSFASRRDALVFFLGELHRMEDEFSRYLDEQVDGNATYHDKAERLMQAMLQDRRPSASGQKISESILSFNYTSFPLGRKSDVEYTNVHGNLFGEIVFGIDGTDCMDDEDVVPFTKTHRIMDLGSSGEHKIVRKPTITPVSGETALIKFYGHSLGHADYAYFQSLFDSVSLYTSHTHLIFYYRPHGGADDIETRRRRAKEKVMRNATRLLVDYGKTMDNVDHGRNLIHKLLLEGRLSVQELTI